jgi:hypothetical protein
VGAASPTPRESASPPEQIRRWVREICGPVEPEFEPMAGGAGARRYWRVRPTPDGSAVLMHARPEDPSIRPPALRRDAPDLPFLIVSDLLERHGLPVPARRGIDPTRRWVLLEDLGDRRLCDLGPAAQRAARAEAVDLIARIHAIPWESALPFERHFDLEWIRFELDLFLDELGARGRPRMEAELEPLARRIAALARVLCVRDYQSQNLMIDPAGKLRLLDYQDALLAPAELDLAALLHDSYVEIAPDERRALLERYAMLRGAAVDPASFSMLVVQRKAKDWSRFRSLARCGDARFAPYVARARDAVLEAAAALPSDLAGAGRSIAQALGEDPA